MRKSGESKEKLRVTLNAFKGHAEIRKGLKLV